MFYVLMVVLGFCCTWLLLSVALTARKKPMSVPKPHLPLIVGVRANTKQCHRRPMVLPEAQGSEFQAFSEASIAVTLEWTAAPTRRPTPRLPQRRAQRGEYQMGLL